jgi:hypothetical protein
MSLLRGMILLLTPESLGSLTIRYIHFFSSIIWWGIMFFMFVIIFPVNKDGRYSTLFPRVQRFMKIIASVAMASGIFLRQYKVDRGGSWGYALITGAIFSVFVYIHILMPSTSTLRKNANTMNYRKNSQRGKISKRFVPWLLFTLLTITIALMLYASDSLF